MHLNQVYGNIENAWLLSGIGHCKFDKVEMKSCEIL